MNPSPGPEYEGLYRAARKATRGWDQEKALMALRAAGLDAPDGERATLDAIAADLGVSRETVRRARNKLLEAIGPPQGVPSDALFSALELSAPSLPSAESPSTARALRRLLTMTGPLAWDEVLSAWARARGKPPYVPLPADVASMQSWVTRAGGLRVSASGDGPVTVSVAAPEDLDQVSTFLYESLKDQPGGVDRGELLQQAEQSGLKTTTVATTLSIHPAVTRVGRGMWSLRGRQRVVTDEPARISAQRRLERVRPTTFSWAADGALLIEFSVPKGPSPVVAIPRAVSEIVEGREFAIEGADGATRLTVRNARVWGFGPVLSELDLASGSRANLALNVLEGIAAVSAAEGKRTPQ